MPKKIGSLDKRIYAQLVEDSLSFIDTGGVAYPRGLTGIGILQKKPSGNRKNEVKPVIVKKHSTQLWENWKKEVDNHMQTITKKETIKLEEGFKVQSYLFDKSKWTLSKAKSWLKEKGSSTEVDEKENTYRFRQAEPSEFTRMRTVDKSNPNFDWLPVGVQAVVGPTKTKSSLDMRNFPRLAIVDDKLILV